ncbi:VOC family protein [Desulfosarcina ovata]|uniref:Lactoylglutathione lyase n=1 Tax=Desulfosarcina ovata subsp. ovata TaxID=2752305 RepID=A0A5K8ACQ1_9BACT|nr:VOC family protein [Desulfosarcina ovata]BBO89720.1 lactoylglutathione lyase [Desulfosarcina ovata subsp. ovata]
MNYRFHHLHLLCGDLEATVDFFTRILGAALKGYQKFGTADGASLDLNGTIVNLRVAAEGETVNTDITGPVYGYHHMALGVDDTDAACRELTDRGVEFVVQPRNTDDGLRVAFFKGPDDVLIELVQEL